MVLSLDKRAEEQRRIVYEVRRVLCQVQHQKIKVQTHNTLAPVVEEDLRVEAEGPGEEGDPAQHLVQHLQPDRVPRRRHGHAGGA